MIGQDRRGLTLIELLMVLVIIALSATLVYATLDGLLPSSRLGSVAREIGAAISMAQQQAALRGQETRIEYDMAGGKVRVLAVSNSNTGETGQTTLEQTGQSVVLSKKIQLAAVLLSADQVKAGGVVSVTCHPTGGVTSHIVHLRGEGTLVYSIQVHALTGAVNFFDKQISWPAVVKDAN